MKLKILILLALFSTWAQAINIRVYDLHSKEVKIYSTQEDFKIPVETTTQKCFLNKTTKDSPWSYNCSSRVKGGDYVPGYRTEIDCEGTNRIISSYIMDIKTESGGIIASTRYSIVISCDAIIH